MYIPKTNLLISAFAMLLCSMVFAEEHQANQVVPAAERERAVAQKLSGPTQNRGVESVTPIGHVNLEHEFKDIKGHILRAREIVIAPGGVIAVHEHHARPGIAYILEGEIVEHRNDHPEPLLRSQGEAAFEKTGVAHWWENRSDKKVRALVVDIVPGT
jgi:quercetin dioxygenase-like cupin family protein